MCSLPRAIAALEDMVREKVYERLDALNPDSFDVVADFSALFPNEVITSMLGVPKQDRDQIRQWLDILWSAIRVRSPPPKGDTRPR